MIECFIVVKDIQVDEGQTRYKKYARYENLCLTDGMAGTVSFVSVTWPQGSTVHFLFLSRSHPQKLSFNYHHSVYSSKHVVFLL